MCLAGKFFSEKLEKYGDDAMDPIAKSGYTRFMITRTRVRWSRAAFPLVALYGILVILYVEDPRADSHACRFIDSFKRTSEAGDAIRLDAYHASGRKTGDDATEDRTIVLSYSVSCAHVKDVQKTRFFSDCALSASGLLKMEMRQPLDHLSTSVARCRTFFAVLGITVDVLAIVLSLSIPGLRYMRYMYKYGAIPDGARGIQYDSAERDLRDWNAKNSGTDVPLLAQQRDHFALPPPTRMEVFPRVCVTPDVWVVGGE